MSGADIRWIKCNDDFTVDRNSLTENLDKNISIAAIANPNSPTGSEFTLDSLFKCLKKCQKLGILLLIDEAYFPFSKSTMMPYVGKEDNLVVTRTFSKAFGLGGCRAGFMAASSNLLQSIPKARPMYEINSLSALAIKICLKDLSVMNQYVKDVGQGKDYILKESRRLGLTPYPSRTNFMNIRFPANIDAAGFEKFGRTNGVLFKGSLGSGCFNNCIRITLGPKKYMKKFVNLLEDFINKNG